MKFTMKGLLVLVVVICLIGVLLIPAIHRAKRNARVTACVGNLAQLWKMTANYMIQFHEHKPRPHSLGDAFWLRMAHTDPPLITHELYNLFHCPMRGYRTTLKSDFRGPARWILRMADGDVVGADKVGNHGGGGNVLRKSGDVTTVAADDPLWTAAASSTIP